MDEHIIGLNAGKIWNLLSINMGLTKHQITTKLNLTDDAFHEAIGWLSKENKIKIEGEFFSLGPTNLTEKIGTNAGLVFRVLNELPQSVTPLNELSVLTENELHQALGWLAREGKLTDFFSIPNANTLESSEETIVSSDVENNQLQEEIAHRNQVINDLTQQLSKKQTEFVFNADVIENLNTQLMDKNQCIKSINDELQVAHTQIHHLTEEIQTLSDDLFHRNQIIQELTRQVTDTQTMLLEQTDSFKRLQVKASFQKSLSATAEINDQVNHIQILQNDCTNPQIRQINDLPSETRLYNETPPSLDLQTQQNLSHNEQSEKIDVVHNRIDTVLQTKKPCSLSNGEK
jgi:hypothetical protein